MLMIKHGTCSYGRGTSIVTTDNLLLVYVYTCNCRQLYKATCVIVYCIIVYCTTLYLIVYCTTLYNLATYVTTH